LETVTEPIWACQPKKRCPSSYECWRYRLVNSTLRPLTLVTGLPDFCPVVVFFPVPLPEKELISRIRRLAQSRAVGTVRLGIGDDCAVLTPKPGHELLVTTDFSLEGTHFRSGWHSPESVGHRCLSRGLSDIAAMGGEPVAAFLSLALPYDLRQNWVDGFLDGFLALANRTKTVLAGGDIAQSRHGILADVTVTGSLPAKSAIRRNGARPGDVIYVTGALGGSAATLRQMFAGEKIEPHKHRSHFFPEPRLGVAKYLREKKLATAMIDLSDGLSTDLAHITEDSKAGAVINQLLLPIAQGASLEDALHGGEDYELLFTAKRSAKVPIEIAGVPMTEIGWITKAKKVLCTDLKSKPRKLEIKGWEHFTPSQSTP
jgi:thiamine-monophosphate kinase